MKKHTSRIHHAMLILFLLGLWGCEDPPKPNVSKAQQALEHARQAGAEDSTPDLFADAMKYLQEATDEIQTQDDKVWLFRDYAQANELLQKSEDNAIQAMSQATTQADHEAVQDKNDGKPGKEEVVLAVAKAREQIGEAKALLRQAPSGKDVEVVLEMMENDIYAAESTLDEIPKEINPRDYPTVTEKAEKVQGVATRIRDQIRLATEKAQDRTP